MVLYSFVSSNSCQMVPCSLASGNLLQLKLLRGFPGVGTFFFGFGALGNRGAKGARGGKGGAGTGGGGGQDGGGGGGGAELVSMTALFKLLT